jgi:ribosomal protein L9
MTKSKIIEQIKYWKEVFKPTGNMGKWYASVRVAKLTEQLDKRNKKLSKKNDK